MVPSSIGVLRSCSPLPLFPLPAFVPSFRLVFLRRVRRLLRSGSSRPVVFPSGVQRFCLIFIHSDAPFRRLMFLYLICRALASDSRGEGFLSEGGARQGCLANGGRSGEHLSFFLIYRKGGGLPRIARFLVLRRPVCEPLSWSWQRASVAVGLPHNRFDSVGRLACAWACFAVGSLCFVVNGCSHPHIVALWLSFVVLVSLLAAWRFVCFFGSFLNRV